MKLKHSSRRRPARIEMIPLIDIVFLLLVFFIYAMLSMAVHRGMEVALPESSRSVLTPEASLTVSIISEGAEALLYLDREPVSPEELETLLRARGQGEGEAVEVLLFADKGVSYQKLYEVLDRVSAAGISAISLQAVQKR